MRRIKEELIIKYNNDNDNVSSKMLYVSCLRPFV